MFLFLNLFHYVFKVTKACYIIVLCDYCNLLLNIFHIFVDLWIMEIIHNHKGRIKFSRDVGCLFQLWIVFEDALIVVHFN